MFAGNFAPAGWMLCQGQTLAISEFETLFNLIGTTYGGDGQETFALPDLQGRFPMHQGQGFLLAETGGVETVTLTLNQIPSHGHPFASQPAPGTNSKAAAVGNVLADEISNPEVPSYAPFVQDANQRTLSPQVIASAGGSQPHDNMMAFVVVNFIISLFGVFPSPT
jgi:microcystin-dependent protein